MFDSNGDIIEEKGLYLIVDGGYVHVTELLVGDPDSLDNFMNFWTTMMESERKHVECGFGILKARFRILKLPIRMHKFAEIDDMFFTCCILHNMCLDIDGADDGWHLGDDGLDDAGWFSSDDNHKFYHQGNLTYDITRDIDYSMVGNSTPVLGSTGDEKRGFFSKRNKIAQSFYYMFRKKLINFD